MTDRDRLTQALKGNPEGFTRTELAYRLNMPDRAVRKLIEETVAEGEWPIIADRTAGGEAKYRIARAHEHDLINQQNREDTARAISLHQKARGRRLAFERRYQAGGLFLDAVPAELERAS
jgi:hypothetical protein